MYDEELKTKKRSKDKEKKSFSKPSFHFNFDMKSALKKFGILALAVFAFIFISTKWGQHSEQKVFKENLEEMKTAAYKYFKENERPEEINEEYNITLQDLIDADFVEPLKDKKGNLCDNDSSNITLTKKTKTKFDLIAHLNCNNKEEEKKFNLTYTNTSNSASNTTIDGKVVYYKLQKDVTTNHYTYSCPSGYVLSGKYCYSKSSVLTATPIAKYKTTAAKKTKASYKKDSEEYEYVEPVLINVDASYTCANKDATLVDDQCIITKPATLKDNTSYSCSQGDLDGSKCIIYTPAIKKDYKYTCPTGKLIDESQCLLKKKYTSHYSCPADYPNRNGDRCYYTEKADRDWGEWHASEIKTYTYEKDDTDTKKYELLDSYEGANHKMKYVYKVYNRTKEYVCDSDSSDNVELKGSRCYYYISAYEDKKCPAGYDLNEDATECVKLIDATKKKSSVTYDCPSDYTQKGSGSKTICYKKIDAQKIVNQTPKCTSGYTPTQNSDGSYVCTKSTPAKKVEAKIDYVCPTGYEQKGSGTKTQCYKKTKLEGYYYCKNTEARLEGTDCIRDAKTELTGYKCPSGYDLNGNSCIKILSGDKISATKTNNPDINATYKWSTKKSESGWIWTGETKEL